MKSSGQVHRLFNALPTIVNDSAQRSPAPPCNSGNGETLCDHTAVTSKIRSGGGSGVAYSATHPDNNGIISTMSLAISNKSLRCASSSTENRRTDQVMRNYSTCDSTTDDGSNHFFNIFSPNADELRDRWRLRPESPQNSSTKIAVASCDRIARNICKCVHLRRAAHPTIPTLSWVDERPHCC